MGWSSQIFFCLHHSQEEIYNRKLTTNKIKIDTHNKFDILCDEILGSLWLLKEKKKIEVRHIGLVKEFPKITLNKWSAVISNQKNKKRNALFSSILKVREAVQNILRGGVYEIGGIRPLDAYPPHFFPQPSTLPPFFAAT